MAHWQILEHSHQEVGGNLAQHWDFGEGREEYQDRSVGKEDLMTTSIYVRCTVTSYLPPGKPPGGGGPIPGGGAVPLGGNGGAPGGTIGGNPGPGGNGGRPTFFIKIEMETRKKQSTHQSQVGA